MARRPVIDLNKARALEALLSHNSMTEAAAAAGISRRTLYNYIRNDESFGEAYRAACDHIAVEQMDVLNESKSRAMVLLTQLMDDATQPATIRIKAAQTILAAATKQQEAVKNAKAATELFGGLSL